MKNIFQKHSTSIVPVIMLAIVISSCTKLDTKLKNPDTEGQQTAAGAPEASSLSKVYEIALNQLPSQENWFALSEHSTDELMGPTRGTDWDDFGKWRKLHLHTWDGSHEQINNAWNGINGALFQTTLLAESATAPAQDVAEAKFLRAYMSYLACDLWGQVQHRPATAAVDVIPDVYSRSEAVDFIISELEAIIPTLPSYTHATRNKATKEAAQFLLAKAYLNKGVFKQDPSSPAGPFTFDPADMNKVIELCNAIEANTELSVANDYWDNFSWRNGANSTENIFVRQNSQGINVVWASCMGNHYNMPPDGWNGFTTLADFYNSFQDGDIRKSDTVAGLINYVYTPDPTIPGDAADPSIYLNAATQTSSYVRLTGRGAGFLVGQQKGPVKKRIGKAVSNLKDRSGNPLIFTETASLFFSTESRGIRTNKYPLDPASMNSGGFGSPNEFVMFRLSDAILMEAEAVLRGGTSTQTAVDLVNSIRSKRNVAALASVDLTALLAERGRELYLEGVRRNDLVRFGKFNDPVNERPTASAPTKVVFPIPLIALSSNPNLKQNEGY